MKRFEPFALDTANECLWHQGRQIPLASKPFAVLRYLVENPNRLITHDELLDALWPETYVQPQVLRTYVLELRKILDDDARQPRFIQTVPKRGYSFIAAVNDGPAPSPSPGTISTAAVDLFGRDDELRRLLTTARNASAGQRQVVFITGEAGIGKTAIVQNFRSLSPMCMVAGHCVEGVSEKEPYYAIIEAIGQSMLLPDHEGISSPDSTRPRTFHDRPGELCEALEEFARDKLFVLVIEDLQWAHEATLHLISALARRSAPAKLVVLATYRPQHSSTTFALRSVKQDLLIRQLCTEIALEPLSKDAARRLLSRKLGELDPPPYFSDFVYQRSGGNPLFLNALLDHMIAERWIVQSGDGREVKWHKTGSVSHLEISFPQNLAQLIELEIDRLSPQEQRVLEAASLMSVAFPVWSVATALEEDPETVNDICDTIERRTGLVRRAGHDDLPDGTRSDFYTFAHELYREVLYARQTTSRRAKGHTRIAERLKALFAGREGVVATELAMHFEAAGNWQRTVCALRLGALHAQQRCAYQESTQLLHHALGLAENLPEPDRAAVVNEVKNELRSLSESAATQQKAG
ncbi:AAA family ATPase [Occallatibacter savannae]|uniref:AAA family ATPase n=1 Tax=Occallatibacter savannae TaxID=1002691 RepID=UPI000D68DD9B|nr:AAA family ATPase [Occallatibacter savannae]